MTEAERQAFEIWRSNTPPLTFKDLYAAGIVGDYNAMAKKVFFSDSFAYKRWLITSGFQEFIDFQCDKRPTDWDGDYTEEESDRAQAEKVIKSLWLWMLHNEKAISTSADKLYAEQQNTAG